MVDIISETNNANIYQSISNVLLLTGVYMILNVHHILITIINGDAKHQKWTSKKLLICAILLILNSFIQTLERLIKTKKSSSQFTELLHYAITCVTLVISAPFGFNTKFYVPPVPFLSWHFSVFVLQLFYLTVPLL